MALKITSDCNNCGACEPECPNNAISAGADVFEIKADLCTECVGFHGEPQCASVCPVEACVNDEATVETEAALIAKVKQIHPSKDFSSGMPSRYAK